MAETEPFGSEMEVPLKREGSIASAHPYTYSAITKARKRPVNASLVRHALRLIHCMQKERGASCAYCSDSEVAGDGDPLHMSAMGAARADTNVAIRLFRYREKPIVPVTRTLTKIRNVIDNQTSVVSNSDESDQGDAQQTNSPTSAGFHQFLVMFNTLISTLISTVLEVYVEQPVDNTRKEHKQRMASAGSRRMKPPLSSSLPDFAVSPSKLYAPFGVDVSPPSIFVNSNELSDPGSPNEIMEHLTRNSRRNRNTAMQASLSSSPGGSSLKAAFKLDQCPVPPHCESRNGALLALLSCFVRLKESTGVQRATLSSILATDHNRISNLIQQRFVNDLVLEVENQRRIVQALELIQIEDLSLYRLIQDCVKYGPEMVVLQQKIMSDFDLVGFQSEFEPQALWEFITIYMDKLHSLELLIIEEIECSIEDGDGAFESSQTSLGASLAQSSPDHTASFDLSVLKKMLRPVGGSSLKQLIEGTTGTNTEAHPEELRRKLEDMSATDLKQKMLSWLSSHENSAKGSSMAGTIFQDATPPPPPLLFRETSPSPPALNSEPDTGVASKEWDINLYELLFQKRIGRGNAATTYMASWTDQTVAVKVAAITEFGLDGWKAEVQMLSKLHHPNIIRLLGSVYNKSPLTYCLVLEYCDAGDLESVLKKRTPPNLFFNVSKSISNGMAYLHSRGVIHRDIKPGNVLLHGNVQSGNYTVKVTDFGVATQDVDDGPTERTGETGTYRWMAPEVIRHEFYSNMADVYSFACLMWQLLTHEDPFANYSQIEAAGLVALEHARPEFPNGAPAQISKVIEACWCENPDERFPFEAVSKALKEIELNLNDTEKRWTGHPLGHPVYKPREEEEEVLTIHSLPNIVPLLKEGKGLKHPPSNKRPSVRNIFAFRKKETKET